MRGVAVAVIRGEAPDVFVAEDLDTLHWVLALEWVARADPARLGEGLRDSLRQALLDERWADAVVGYMDHLDTAVDVYDGHELYGSRDVAMGPTELQFRRLFRD
jgi:hypothetical protein